MSKVVCIGGFGHAGLVFDDMLGMPEVNVVGLAPAYDGEDIGAFVAHEGCQGVPVYPDYTVMLDTLSPNVAVISTRLDVIPEVVMRAANHGCHIIAEKPLALDKGTLARVHAAVTRKDVRLTAMLSTRSQAEFVTARKAYQSGVIGDAVLVNARKSYKYGRRPEWFGVRQMYGGTIGWVGIHAFDMINYVTGLDVRQVGAVQGNFAHPERPACEDHCGLIAKLSNGGHATISIDLLRPDTAATHGDDWLRVVGTRGIIEARACDHTCMLLRDGGEPESLPLEGGRRLFREFLGALTGDNTMAIYQRESFRLSYVCLCGQESAENGRFVDIDADLFM